MGRGGGGWGGVGGGGGRGGGGWEGGGWVFLGGGGGALRWRCFFGRVSLGGAEGFWVSKGWAGEAFVVRVGRRKVRHKTREERRAAGLARASRGALARSNCSPAAKPRRRRRRAAAGWPRAPCPPLPRACAARATCEGACAPQTQQQRRRREKQNRMTTRKQRQLTARPSESWATRPRRPTRRRRRPTTRPPRSWAR